MIATSLFISRNTAASLLLALTFSVSAAPAVVQHDLTVELDPDRGQIKVVDRIRLPEGLASAGGTVDFYLNAAFEPRLSNSTARLEPASASLIKDRVRRHRVQLSDRSKALTLSYSGSITQADGAYELGHIGPEGVYLTEASAWYPLFNDTLLTYSMQVRAPQGWTAISQGIDAAAPSDSARATRLWRETRPQTEIVVLAGRFIAYRQKTADLDARVYLRRPDPALAERYLQATAHYVDLYRRLLGPYPYEKFALVENFWETGYGMPSLALLGPRVIRFPFILHSSFPHEILHNWWGNGVYLNLAGGNWSEGLTAYLADHLVQEQRGRGGDYRLAALQKYASYVDVEDDFPLSAFRSKHGEVSQAVGYNKALMFFHMLRQRLGDGEFLEALRLFAAQHQYQPADYDDLRSAFEAASGLDLAFEFQQWVERTGAPRLRLSEVSVAADSDGFELKGVLVQVQPGAPYSLRVPVAVQIEGQPQAARRVISVKSKREEFELKLPSRPIALHVDPEFDLFRRLSPGEAAVSLGDLLGAKDVVFIVPAGAKADAKAAYSALARALGGAQTIDDTSPLPFNKNVWLFGWDNAHFAALSESVAGEGIVLSSDGARFGDDAYRRSAACVVIAARRENYAAHGIGFIGCDYRRAIAGLARKIPHYGKYGFLAFSGDEPTNIRKAEWPVRASLMTVVFDPQSAEFPPPLPRRHSLADPKK